MIKKERKSAVNNKPAPKARRGKKPTTKNADSICEVAQQQWLALFQEAPIAILIADPETGIILEANTQAEELIKRPISELIGMHHCSLHPPEDMDAHKALFQERVNASGKSYIETEVLTSTGEKIPVEIATTFIQLAGGKQAIQGTFRNITERKKAEAILRESEEHLISIVETCPVGITIVNCAGKITFANSAAEKILGLSRTEMIGRAYNAPHWNITAVNGEPFNDEDMPFVRVMREGTPLFGTEHAITGSDGQRTILSINASPLHDKDGHIQSVVTAISDISERFRIEEEQRKLERQMLHSQKLESLGVLAGGIAHDFNNLLMAIMGNAELAIIDLSKDSPVYASLVEIDKISRRAAELCQHMLAFSGKGHFLIEPINLSHLVQDMNQMLKISVSKKASMQYHLASKLPFIEADASQMRQIVMNLLVNASEAIGDQNGVITITTGTMQCDSAYLNSGYLNDNSPEGLYVYLDIADTGCGMNETTLSKIFDPFFTTKFPGRGLGLAAVMGIVRGHKGAIKVFSEPNHGATFRMLFPSSNPKTPAEDEEMPGRISENSGVILFADDEEFLRALGKKMLERLGFTVFIATNGSEALKIFRKRQDEIDVVLLDLTMPEMDGEEAFREMKRLRPDVRVLLASGYSEQDISIRFAGKGLAGFIPKPYQISSLREKLKKIMKK